MPFSLRRLTKLQLLAGGLLMLIVATGLAVSGRWLLHTRAKQMPLSSNLAVASAMQAKPKETPKIEVELVTLRPRGFDPATITRPKGPFMLAIENRSGTGHISFQFDKDVGKKLKPVTPKKSVWADVIDPNPGTYVLTETTHPNWSLTLIITPPNK